MSKTPYPALAAAVFAAAGGAACLVGCNSAPAASDNNRVSAAADAAPSSTVTGTQAWRDAEALAALDADRLTVVGTGASMRPVYGENTVLVLQKVRYVDLAPGMTVAYRSATTGHVVVHTLLRQEREGWVTAGLNNGGDDRGRVTEFNLLGVVYASFAHDGVR